MKYLLFSAGTVLALLVSAMPASAAEGEASLYGTRSAAAQTGIGKGDAGANGFESELRLVMGSAPEPGVDFRAEGGYSYVYGLSSPSALAFDAGLAAPPAASDLPPGTDLHRTLFLDQAWARATLDRFTLQAGIIPVSWGTGYLSNPTSRTTAPEFPGENRDIVRGKPGISAVLSLPGSCSLETYALADAREKTAVPGLDETDSDAFPFGTRIQKRTDWLDVSLSFVRELPAAGRTPRYWYGADAAANAGPVSVYAEGAAARDDSEFCAGFSWTVPGLETVLRSEFIRIASGGVSGGAYDTGAFLAGSRLLLARHYLFAGLEKEDGEAARWKLAGGGLINLDDRSAALSAEAAWIPRLSVELSAFVRYFTGSGLDEFGGSRPVSPDAALRAYRGSAGLSAKWSF